MSVHRYRARSIETGISIASKVSDVAQKVAVRLTWRFVLLSASL